MRRVIVSVLGALLLPTLASCREKPHHFETMVQIVRTETVKDSAGTVVDVDLEYADCPGEQREVFQADAAFAQCIARYKVGEKVPARIMFQQMPDGHFDSEVDKVGECNRTRDSQDERSYEIVHQCHEIKVNSVVIGFRCDRKPSKELLAKCPWFRRT